MKTSTKILSVLLSFCLLAAFLPTASFAANGETYAVYNADSKTLTFCVGTLTASGVLRDAGGDPVQGDAYYTGFLGGGVPWSENKHSIQKTVFLDVIAPTTTASWFSDCIALTTIENLPLLDTSNVTTMHAMFCTEGEGCPVESLDLSHFNTANVTDMSDMFMGCTKLTELDVSSFNTGSVTDMSSMFHSCISLKNLDLHKFDTGNVTSMDYMFTLCIGLESVNLSGFDTSKVEGMHSLFFYCTSLQSLDLSSFNSANVTDMKQMLGKCSALSTLTIGENFRFISTNANLPDVPANDVYTGYWVCGSLRCTSAQLTDNYFGAATTGTWVWERGASAPAIDLSGAQVSADDQTYTGDALTPPVTVTLNGTTLTENTDYTVSYSDNTEVGTAKITVTGIGNYTGVAAGSFAIIEPTAITNAKIKVDVRTCINAASKPDVNLSMENNALVEDTDYDVVFECDEETGDATVTINGLGKYNDTITFTFKLPDNTASDDSDTRTFSFAELFKQLVRPLTEFFKKIC